MTMNKALIALALGFALAACSNQEKTEAAAADAAAAPAADAAAAPAADAAAAPAAEKK